MTVTAWRRASSEMVRRLRTRPPVVEGQSPPIFTQRIRISNFVSAGPKGPALRARRTPLFSVRRVLSDPALSVAFHEHGLVVEPDRPPGTFEREPVRQAGIVAQRADSGGK